MKILNEDINNLSFDDFKVKSMLLNENTKTLTILIEGGFLSAKASMLQFKNCIINAHARDAINISRYQMLEKQWVSMDVKEYDPLKEINEIYLDGNLILRGFGKISGEWLEYQIILPELDVSYET